ncbi:MAG: hypothetical protein KC593_20235 [Myxococcales bacterium]|nr:hypothetical protein [Myxococcales bacterium]
MNEHPTNGTRVRFALRSGTDDGATYDVTVFAHEDAFELTATLDASTGKVQLGATAADAPEWLHAGVLPFAKQILSARRAAPTGQWPRRVLRWRAAAGSRPTE